MLNWINWELRPITKCLYMLLGFDWWPRKISQFFVFHIRIWGSGLSSRIDFKICLCDCMSYLFTSPVILPVCSVLFFPRKGVSTDISIAYYPYRRSPISIAAAVIYIITQLSDEKKPLRGIAWLCLYWFSNASRGHILVLYTIEIGWFIFFALFVASVELYAVFQNWCPMGDNLCNTLMPFQLGIGSLV